MGRWGQPARCCIGICSRCEVRSDARFACSEYFVVLQVLPTNSVHALTSWGRTEAVSARRCRFWWVTLNPVPVETSTCGTQYLWKLVTRETRNPERRRTLSGCCRRGVWQTHSGGKRELRKQQACGLPGSLFCALQQLTRPRRRKTRSGENQKRGKL